MEELGRERDEKSERAATDDPKQPFGLQVAILFVRLTVAIATFAAVGMVLATLASLARAFPSYESLIATVVMLTASVLLFAMVGGGSLLDANLSGRAFSWLGKKGAHPARHIFPPLVGGVAVYGAMAILVWLRWMIKEDYDMIVTWPWLGSLAREPCSFIGISTKYCHLEGVDELMRDEESKPPPGVLVTIVFLRVFCIAMILPVLIACLVAMACLVMGSFEIDVISGALLVSGATVGGFLVLLMIALGCDWLVRHLKATSVGTEESTRVQRPIHPARQILLPPLGCLMAYAFLAVLAWLPSTFQTAPSETWPWPVAWSAIGFGAMYLFHILDEKLP